MQTIEASLPGVIVFEPRRFGDSRGFFVEMFQAERYAAAGVPGPFIQDNLSRSTRDVLRGLHLQRSALPGQTRQRPARGGARCRRGRPGRQPDLRQVRLGGTQRGERPPDVRSARLCPRLPRPLRNGRFLLQVRRALQPEGRNHRALVRSGAQYRLARRQSPGLGQGRSGSPALGDTEPSRYEG